MTTATEKFFNRIALIFDFDETLAPSTFEVLLKSLGLDPEKFKAERIEPLIQSGWETFTARAYTLIQESKSRPDGPITVDYLEQVGRDYEFYDGVPEMFDRLRQTARAIIEDIEVEFYLLTAGFVEIPRATSIAKEFNTLWGCEYHFNDKGEVDFVKKIITHPEKVRYILQFAKGLDSTDRTNSPADVYRDVPQEEWHIPLSQIIYVGDGASDMPAFSLMQQERGLAIGVFHSESVEEWEGYEDMNAKRRVQNLAPADFSEGSEMMQSLMLAIESICKQIALRRLSIDE